MENRFGLKKNVLINALLASAFVAPVAVQAAPTSEELDQRIKILERQLEIQNEEAAAKAKDATTATASDKGFSLKKGDYELKIKALVQFDGRFFTDDSNPARAAAPTGNGGGSNQTPAYLADSFLFRRIRPTFEGTLGKLVGFRLTPEFAGDGSALAASLVDAYVDLKFNPAYTVRAGKVKGPVGLERLQSGGSITFLERGFPTELVPNRDLGIQLQGEVLSSTLNYTIGWYNGTADGRDVSSTDGDNRKEFAGRLFAEPFKNSPGFFQGLGFGISGSSGTKKGAAGDNAVRPRFRSPGQNQIFGYSATVGADGDQTRISPQGYFYRNSFGLLAEYVQSKQELANTPAAPAVASSSEFTNDAWQVVTSYVITGEDASYRGVTKVAKPFQIGAPGWGALEVAARYGELDIDDDIFTQGYSSAATSVSKAEELGVGVNWYVTSNVKVAVDYNQTKFEGGALAGQDRKDEKAIFSRLQFSF